MSDSGGTIKSLYILDIADVQKKVAELKRIFQGIQFPSGVPAGLGALSAAQARAAQTAGKLATEQRKAATEAQRLATEQQKTARAVLDLAKADQQLARDTANATAAQDRAAQAALRRRQAEDRAARASQNGGLGPALPRTFAGVTSGGLSQLAGLAGGAFSISAAIDAGQSALKLRETKNVLQALSGSTKVYTDTLATARQQQELFGGSLQDNIEGLQGLLITSRSTGAELSTLTDLAQRLAVLDPVQGAQGARIALSEVLSGDPRSLARRYEIPLSALTKIKDESIPVAERLQVLDQYLNKIGITSAVVKDRIDQDALAFRQAGAAIEEATLKLGGYLATLGAFPARGVTELLNTGSVTGGANAAGANLQGNLVAQAADFEAYKNSILASNNQISEAFKGDPLAGFIAKQRFGLEALNPVQFAYAQRLIETGTATQAATDKARALGVVSDSLTQQVQGQSAAIQALVPTMAQAASGSEANASQVLALNSAYLQGQISADVLKLALEGIVRAQDQAAQAAFQEERETRNLQRSFIDIVPAANAAAAAIAGVGGAGALTRGQQAAAAQSVSGNALGLADRFGGGAGTTFARVDADQRALQSSRDALALSRAKTQAERLAILQGQLARQTTEEGKNRVLLQIEQERNDVAKATGTAADKRLKTEESIYDSIQKQRDAFLDIEELTIRDRQQDRDDAQKRRTAEAILRSLGGRTDARAIDLRGRAEDAVALADVQNRKREFELEQKRATAGGAITAQGRLLQSQAGGGGIPAPAGVIPQSSTGTASSTPASSVGGVDVKVYIDGQEVAARVLVSMNAGLRQAQSGGV